MPLPPVDIIKIFLNIQRFIFHIENLLKDPTWKKEEDRECPKIFPIYKILLTCVRQKLRHVFPGFMLLVYVKCNESETPKIFVISANLAIFPKKSNFLHHLDDPV